MKIKNIIRNVIIGIISGVIVNVFILVCSINIIKKEVENQKESIIIYQNQTKEQNVILKEMVIAIQVQANAMQEQNRILNYNPMEENKK